MAGCVVVLRRRNLNRNADAGALNTTINIINTSVATVTTMVTA